jgi:serine/threonine protein kinase
MRRGGEAVSLAEHSHALSSGARLSQYQISSVLGSGGFGITYLARDMALDAPVAIKEYLPAELAARGGDSKVSAISRAAVADFDWGLQRFLEEARVLAKFPHPNIVRVFQVFEANATAYIVMEYAKGEALSSLIQRQGQLSEDATRAILLPVMDGLKRVHQHGFLHRDIKPANIILREDGGPALIDFGSARQAIETKSRSITSIVTEGYAPLEQYDPNGNQGPWTDIYALGAVAYKCMTGKTPPPSTSRIRNDPLAPLGEASRWPVSPAFEAAMKWAMSVYEEDRPQTIDALAKALGSPPPAHSRPAGGHADAEATQLIGRSGRPSGAGPQAGSTGASVFSGQGRPSKRTMILGFASAAVVLLTLAFGLRLLPKTASNQPPPSRSEGHATAPVNGSELSTAPGLPATISGPVQVIDTATLLIGKTRVHLAGVTGLSGDFASVFAKTLTELGGKASCDRVPDSQSYDCSVPFPGSARSRADLAEIVLLNGAALPATDATPSQRQKSATAKAAARGVWKKSN